MPTHSRLHAAVAALALATLLAGRASGTPAVTGEPEASAPLVPLAELDALDDPKSWHSESTAVLYDMAITPVTDAPEQSLPVTVTLHGLAGDREVTVTDTSKILG